MDIDREAEFITGTQNEIGEHVSREMKKKTERKPPRQDRRKVLSSSSLIRLVYCGQMEGDPPKRDTVPYYTS